MGLSHAHGELKGKSLQSAEQYWEGLLESRGLVILMAREKTLDKARLER